ncbi:MAG: hypothetical protein ACRCX8_17645 [Sarcina sp.]
MKRNGKLVLSINNEIGLPIYNANICLQSKKIKEVVKTNLCGLTSCDLDFDDYVLNVSANEYTSRKFKISFNETTSFLSITLKYLDNIIYGHVLDAKKLKGKFIKVYLLYEITSGTFVRVKETIANTEGKYEFKNIPRGNYKIEAISDEN